MTEHDTTLRVLVPLEEYKSLKKIAQMCTKHCQSKIHSEKSVTIKDGSGPSNELSPPGERRMANCAEDTLDSCEISKNIDQNIDLIPKEVIVNSDSAQTSKTVSREEKLTLQNIVSHLRPRYQAKGRKLLSILLEHPDDFGYDQNGVVTIFKNTLGGKNL